jgi:hypothetical protein
VSQQIARRYFLAIVTLALAIRIGYVFVTPAFEAPDEYSHYSYVRFLYSFRYLPIQANPAVSMEELEFHQPPLYYFVAALLFPSTKWVQTRPLLPLRFLNILFSMLTIGIAYYFASTVLPGNLFAMMLICNGVALLPTYSYLSATIRNGVFATFFASLGFYLCAKAVLDEDQQRDARWCWIGVVAGLALLSMFTAIGFVCAASLILLTTSPNRRASLHRAGWFTVGLMSTAGWWFVRNWIVYGKVLRVVEDGSGFLPPPVSWDHEKHSAIVLFKTFWAVFGRINEFHFADIYRFYWWFVGIAVLGLIRYMFQMRKDLRVELVTLFVVAISVSLAATFYYAHNYNSDQGRYMFPTLLPITTFIAIGLSTLCPERYHRLVLDTVLFSFAGINTVVIARLASIY